MNATGWVQFIIFRHGKECVDKVSGQKKLWKNLNYHRAKFLPWNYRLNTSQHHSLAHNQKKRLIPSALQNQPATVSASIMQSINRILPLPGIPQRKRITPSVRGNFLCPNICSGILKPWPVAWWTKCHRKITDCRGKERRSDVEEGRSYMRIQASGRSYFLEILMDVTD